MPTPFSPARSATPPPWRAGLSCALAVFLLTVLALREPFRGWQAAVELSAERTASHTLAAEDLDSAARHTQREQPAFAELRWSPPATAGAAVLRVEGPGRDRRQLQELLNEFARAVRSRITQQQTAQAEDQLQAVARRHETLAQEQTLLARQIEAERRQLWEERLVIAQHQAAARPPAAGPAPPATPAPDPQLQRVRNLRDQLALLSQTRTDEHPEITRIRAELIALESSASGAPAPAGQVSPTTTPSDTLELLPPAARSSAAPAAQPTRRMQYVASEALPRPELAAPATAPNLVASARLAELQARLTRTAAALSQTAAERAEAERQRAQAAQSPVRLAPATITRRWGGAVPWPVAWLGLCLALAAGAGGWRAAMHGGGDLTTAAAEAGLPLLGGVSLGRDRAPPTPVNRWLPAAVQTAELLVIAVLVVVLVGVWGSPDIAALLRSDPLAAAAMAVDYLHQGGPR